MVKLLILKNKHNRKVFISSILKQLKLLKNLVAYDLKNESIKREIFLLNFNSKHPVKVKSNLNPTFTGKKEDGKWLLEISQKLWYSSHVKLRKYLLAMNVNSLENTWLLSKQLMVHSLNFRKILKKTLILRIFKIWKKKANGYYTFFSIIKLLSRLRLKLNNVNGALSITYDKRRKRFSLIYTRLLLSKRLAKRRIQLRRQYAVKQRQLRIERIKRRVKARILARKRRIKRLLRMKRRYFRLFKRKQKIFNKKLLLSTISLIKKRYKRLFFVWRWKVRRRLNIYLNYNMHNFFVTVTNFRNRPLFFSSAGKVSLGRNKKQKISIQAVEEICSSISRHVIERGYNRSVNVLFKSFFLNKRIKLALKALSQGGLRIRKLIDISPKPHNSGLRLSKTRRI